MTNMMNINGLFITGTDTGVGKTIVAGAIAAYLGSNGKDVGVMKPVETGCKKNGGELVPVDAKFLRRASNATDFLGAICPYRFTEPLAPAVAAKITGKKIDTRLIVKVYKALARQHNAVIVEGAGGLMVPLYEKYLNLDLAAELGLPLIIVARPGLGTINHTLLTVEAARSRGLDIFGIILNHTAKKADGVAEKTNVGVIRELSGVKRVCSMPFVPGVKRSRDALLSAGAFLSGQGFFGLTKK
jgi:dethiobiotin synthetase